LLTHGFLVDEQGRKFSKSLGNGLGLEDVLKLTSGNVDVVRLWACSSDWSKDMKVKKFILI
jgi:isoleucyl-tRNA synthetase